MPERDLSSYQKDLLKVMYEWQGYNYRPFAREKYFLRNKGLRISNIISPDLLFMELCLRSSRLQGDNMLSFPKKSAQVVFSRSIRSLITKGIVYGFLPSIHKAHGLTLLGRMDTDRSNIYKQRLIGLAFTAKGLRLTRELEFERNIGSQRRIRRQQLSGKVFIVYLYRNWGQIHYTDARGRQLDRRIPFKTRAEGVKQFKKVINSIIEAT